MAYQVVWSPNALADVEGIATYISRDSTSYASAVVRKIIKSTRDLENHPLAGRMVPEFEDRQFEKFLLTATVVYRFGSETVTIAAVIHGKREFTTSFEPEAHE